MKTIFVSIASYRDAQCPETIESIYTNAKYPTRVYLGICQQNKEEDIPCIDKTREIIAKWESQMRIIKLPHYEAKGPTWARYLCSRLWDNEDYYLQIDSHTKLIKDWDEKLIKMVENIPYEKSVISHYPPMIEDYTTENSNNTTTNVPRICKSFFNDRGMLSFEGAEIHNTNGECYEVPYVAGGMFFCKSDFLKELPFDPTLDYLFVGEEILLSARFWTHGWNIYTPSENIVYHFYTRANEPKIWTDTIYRDDPAFEKVQCVLKLKESETQDEKLKYYGMGNVRSLDEYYKFAGIDLKNKRIVKNFCRPNNKFNDETEEIEKTSYYLSSNKMKKRLLMTMSSSIIILIIIGIILLIQLQKKKK
jgi:hypothetical protein